MTFQLSGNAAELYERVMVPLWFGRWASALGDRRAQSVRRVLLLQGASSDQIETVSYGEEQPAVAASNEEAWRLNRRVELIYTVN